MSELLTDPDIERLTVKKPALRWRNKWLTHEPPIDADTGESLGDGPGIYDSPRDFASKLEAEREAQRVIAINTSRQHVSPFWLGAFPVEAP